MSKQEDKLFRQARKRFNPQKLKFLQIPLIIVDAWFLKPIDKLVLGYLFFNKEFEIFPKQEIIASQLGMRLSLLQSCLKRLKDSDFIEIVPRPPKTSKYILRKEILEIEFQYTEYIESEEYKEACKNGE